MLVALLQHDDAHAGLCELLRDDGPAGAGADHADVRAQGARAGERSASARGQTP